MPVALALPEVEAIIIVVGAALLMLVVAQLYLSGRQARGYAANLPLVSGTVIDGIDFLLSHLTASVTFIDSLIERALTGAVAAFGQLSVWAMRYALGPVLGVLHWAAAATGQLIKDVHWIVALALPAALARIEGLEHELARIRDVVLARALVELADVIRFAHVELGGRLAAAEALLLRLGRYESMLYALSQLAGGPAFVIRQLLSALATTISRVARLEADSQEVFARVGVLEQELARQREIVRQLSALLLLAGLSSVAIKNLARVGRNPCRPCGDFDLLDLEGRVASVEMDNL